jgi:hypothetical protein
MKEIKNLIKVLELRLIAIDREVSSKSSKDITSNPARFHYLVGTRDAYQEVYDILTGEIDILMPKK